MLNLFQHDVFNYYNFKEVSAASKRAGFQENIVGRQRYRTYISSVMAEGSLQNKWYTLKIPIVPLLDLGVYPYLLLDTVPQIDKYLIQ